MHCCVKAEATLAEASRTGVVNFIFQNCILRYVCVGIVEEFQLVVVGLVFQSLETAGLGQKPDNRSQRAIQSILRSESKTKEWMVRGESLAKRVMIATKMFRPGL